MKLFGIILILFIVLFAVLKKLKKKGKLPEPVADAVEKVEEVMDTTITAKVDVGIDRAKEIAEDAGDKIRESAEDAIEDVVEKVEDVIDEVRETAEEIIDDVKDRVEAKVEAVTGFTEDLTGLDDMDKGTEAYKERLDEYEVACKRANSTKSTNTRAVIVRGKEFPSLTSAAIFFGLSKYQAIHRCKTEKYTDWQYK